MFYINVTPHDAAASQHQLHVGVLRHQMFLQQFQADANSSLQFGGIALKERRDVPLLHTFLHCW